MSNMFVHAELSVDDVASAKAFYKQLFDWKFNDLGPAMGDYVMIDLGTTAQAGGLTKKMSPEQPTGWLSYVEVASVKNTMAKAVAAGAKPMIEYQDIGGGMGAIGVFLDPQGAALGIWEKGPAAPQPAKKAAKKSAKKAAKKSAKKAAKKPAKRAAKKPAKKAAKKPAKKAKRK